MKTLAFVVLGLIAGTTHLIAQSADAYATYLFVNYFRVAQYDLDAPVVDWTGELLSGAQWRVELYGGATPSSLSPVLNFRGGGREIIALSEPGYFRSGKGFLCVPAVAAHGTAWLQVKVWDASLGATYEAAIAKGLGGYGQSGLFQAQGGNTMDELGVPPPLVGLTSFSVSQVVPEPAVGLMLLAGLPALWWRWRGRWKAEG